MRSDYYYMVKWFVYLSVSTHKRIPHHTSSFTLYMVHRV